MIFHFSFFIICQHESVHYCADPRKVKRRRPQKSGGSKSYGDERHFRWTSPESYHKQQHIQPQKNTGKMEQRGKALHYSRTPSADGNFLILQVVNGDSKNVACHAYGDLLHYVIRKTVESRKKGLTGLQSSRPAIS